VRCGWWCPLGSETRWREGGEPVRLQVPCFSQRRTMYAIHPIPLSEIKAIRRHTPPLGWHHIVVVLVSSLTPPPLYCYKGGVKALISTLKQVCGAAAAAGCVGLRALCALLFHVVPAAAGRCCAAAALRHHTCMCTCAYACARARTHVHVRVHMH
jgi:hypothetical protein